MTEVVTEAKPATPPEWLNSAFMETVLRKSEGDKGLQVVSIESTPVGKPGEYLASQLFRLTVQCQGTAKQDGGKSTKKLVVKIQPDKGVLADTMDSSLFKTELKMYGEFLPKLERVLAENERSLPLPKCVHVSAVPQPIIILEDLAPAGWKGHDLIESFEEAKPITTAIARFHAASFYLSKNKTDFESFQTDLFEKKHPVLEWMFGNNLKAFNEALRTWHGCERFVEPFERAFADYCDRLHNIYSCKTTGRLYNVLNHGDFHAKNLLHQFNDESGGIVESRFLDFQACCWSTPAIDLYYLLNNIVHYKVKAAHKDDLIAFYHAEFTATLKAIGFLGYIPTMLDLQIELLRNGFLGKWRRTVQLYQCRSANSDISLADILHYTCFLQFRFIDFSKIPPEKLATGQVGNLGLENEEYQTLMKSLIPGYVYKGLLE
uniref:CHK kinase-like domain-containing protein n=1 Tax=Anopheles culicifacies TaxID=139723 RepID=A0A182MCB7_9DIPT